MTICWYYVIISGYVYLAYYYYYIWHNRQTKITLIQIKLNTNIILLCKNTLYYNIDV